MSLTLVELHPPAGERHWFPFMYEEAGRGFTDQWWHQEPVYPDSQSFFLRVLENYDEVARVHLDNEVEIDRYADSPRRTPAQRSSPNRNQRTEADITSPAGPPRRDARRGGEVLGGRSLAGLPPNSMHRNWFYSSPLASGCGSPMFTDVKARSDLYAERIPLSTIEQEETSAMSTGELITETFDYDGGREVTVYVPPKKPEAVVFAGDGQLISQWGSILEAADVPSTMVVGAHRLAEETLRLHEYSPGFDPERFAAHERFFVEDVRRWVRTRFGVALPAGRTAVFGVSASGELALAIGLRHPDVYGAIFCASPGAGYRPPGVMPSLIPHTYLVAGTLEPFFLKNAARWAQALRDAGADVVMNERPGSHGGAFWQEEFPLMVAWAFGQ